MLYVVWDWNGTLLDDVTVCLAVMDRMLTRRGIAPIGDVGRYREIFTFPVRDYYALARLDMAAEPFVELADEYMTGYRAAAGACPLMEGAAETLDALERMGAVQILASASRQDDLERQVAERGLAGRFSAVLGMTDQLGGGKAGLAAKYLAEKGIDPAEVVFVGDSVHDWEQARELGCKCVLIAAGHQSKARLAATGATVLDDIRRLPAFLNGYMNRGEA